MAKQEINVKWLDKMAFTTEINGHEIILDAVPEVGGEQGATPKTIYARCPGRMHCYGCDFYS